MKFKDLIKEILVENFQLSDKVYFRSGLLNDEEKEFILNITKGDHTTNLICNIYYDFKNRGHDSYLTDFKNRINDIHDQLIKYNKNVLPIVGFDFNSKDNFFNALIERNIALISLKKLPSIALRNLKQEIRKPRTESQLGNLGGDIRYILDHLHYLENRDEKSKQKIYQKIFKSGHTIEDISKFVDEKTNLIGGGDLSKEKIMEVVDDPSNYIDVAYERGNVMVLRVGSLEGIKELGCNSLWCFTYGKRDYEQWSVYSYNDMVYVIVDFSVSSDDETFMHVLIKPLLPKYVEDEDESPLYNMSNDNYYEPYGILTHYFTKKEIKKIFDFEYDYS